MHFLLSSPFPRSLNWIILLLSLFFNIITCFASIPTIGTFPCLDNKLPKCSHSLILKCNAPVLHFNGASFLPCHGEILLLQERACALRSHFGGHACLWGTCMILQHCITWWGAHNAFRCSDWHVGKVGCEDGERGLLLHDSLQTIVIFSSVDPQLSVVWQTMPWAVLPQLTSWGPQA